MDLYDLWLDQLFIWLRPVSAFIVGFLENILNIDLVLQPYWRHVAVLLALYFARIVALGLRNKATYGFGYAAYNSVTGFFVALVSGISAGAISASSDDIVGQATIVLVALVGATIFPVLGFVFDVVFKAELLRSNLGKPVASRPELFGMLLMRALARVVVGVVLAAAAFSLPIVRKSDVPALSVLLVLVIALAAYWISDGWRKSKSDAIEKNEEWLPKFRKHPFTQLGVSMLQVLLLLGAILCVNFGRLVLKEFLPILNW